MLTQTGVVKWFDDKKGYGFIQKSDGTEVFVHHTGIMVKGFRTLAENQKVQFIEENGQKGLQAKQVTVLESIND